jgi:predicted CoA-binding protein
MKKTLVLGASMQKNRYANMAIRRLINNKIWVVGIGSTEGNIHGCQLFTTQIILKNIHTVSMYLNAKNQEEYYSYIINMRPKRVIFNPGSENVHFESLLTDNQIFFERACTLVLLNMGQY